jgi:hypothetical protein
MRSVRRLRDMLSLRARICVFEMRYTFSNIP